MPRVPASVIKATSPDAKSRAACRFSPGYYVRDSWSACADAVVVKHLREWRVFGGESNDALKHAQRAHGDVFEIAIGVATT